MVHLPDAIEILMPSADAALARRARSLVQFLRLISDDSRSTRAGAISVSLDRARSELDDQDRRRIAGALSDLLRHLLAAMAPGDTFLWWGEPGLDHAGAWRLLDEFRDDLPWLADLPEPAEATESVARRVLDSLERFEASAAELPLWRARLARCAAGARAAEKILRAGAKAAAEGSDGEPRPRAAVTALLAECLLDRGAVREARALLQENARLVEGEPRLRQLLSWSLLCLGDYAGAKGAVVGLAPWSGLLPASLVELRVHRPEWMPCLAGRRPREGRSPAAQGPTTGPFRDRSEIGASVLGVFALHPDGSTSVLLLDAAPALRGGVRGWLRERDGACAVAGQREHELVVSARTVVAHREPERPLEGALGRHATLALALAPVLDDEGEVAGWIYVECEHHRLPALEDLGARASGWKGEVLHRRRGPAEELAAAPDSAARSRRAAEEPAPSACARVFEELVAELGIKTAQRRWWGFGVGAAEPRLLATGGEGAGLSSDAPGRGRALTRAVATSGRVAFDEPDPRLSIDPRSASGLVLPMCAGGALCGLLAIESSRRRDFRDVDVERFARSALRAGLALRVAQFAGWHLERFGAEVWFDAQRPDSRAFLQDFLVSARSRSPVVLAGPPGVGKSILARWLHFEGRGAEDPLRVVDCGSRANAGGVGEWIGSVRGGTLVLEDLERLEPRAQEDLLRILEEADGPAASGSPSARVVGTTRTGLRSAVEEGRLRDDLSQRLDRLQLRVPALRDRREDILPLTSCLARRFAREEGIPEPAFDDEALALLWRQPWAGNVRELESFLFKLVLLERRHAGSAAVHVQPLHIFEIARRFSLPTVRRLPSRHPSRADLLAALRVTRMPTGRTNKTRAALYLGWDPDTLVARMQDAGIGEEIGDETSWSIPVAPEEDPDASPATDPPVASRDPSGV
jgi:hypothetical protein